MKPEKPKCVGLISHQFKIILFVDSINTYWSSHECQALCSAKDLLVNMTATACMGFKVRDQGTNLM